MPYTVTQMTTLGLDVWGKTEIRFVQLVPAASDYPTGGYALTPGTNISLRAIYGVVPIGGQGGYVPVWVPTTGKLMIRGVGAVTPSGTISAPTFTGTPATLTGTNSAPTITTATGTVTDPMGNAASGLALTQTTGRTGITGVQAPTLTMNSYTPAGTVSAPTFTGSATTAGQLSEVAALTDLSSFTFLLMVLGN